MAGWAWLDEGDHDAWCHWQADDGGDGSWSSCDCGNAPDWWDPSVPAPHN